MIEGMVQLISSEGLALKIEQQGDNGWSSSV